METDTFAPGLRAEGQPRDRGILWITPNTVRKHLENVYSKLGVNTRTAAATRFLGVFDSEEVRMHVPGKRSAVAANGVGLAAQPRLGLLDPAVRMCPPDLNDTSLPVDVTVFQRKQRF